MFTSLFNFTVNKEDMLNQEIIKFYKNLSPDFKMPKGVSIMHPYRNSETEKVVKAFYKKFYADNKPRYVLFGINPGRFGAGITGVSFTDPIRLEEICGVKNDFEKRFELSSEFVYEVIEKWGGIKDFYSHFFISSICPLGFVKGGKNLNYYDEKALEKASTPFILDCILKHKAIFGELDIAFCLGKGKNYDFFNKLNEKHHLFKNIIVLPHPRWVMQYRRKRKGEFAEEYVSKLRKVLE